MPIGNIQRKASNETLSSLGMDSTIDSRISSTDIPKMELLKVSYVQQCKEALMQQKPLEPPSFLSHLQSHQQNLRAAGAHNYRYADYKRPSSGQRAAAEVQMAQANITKITLGSRPMPLQPPPTIESWQLFQETKKESINNSTKIPIDDCCNSSNCSSSDTEQEMAEENAAAATLTPDCEKSNSWNYRAKFNTRDIRRDIARAGIKSRADRIARIELTDCDHRRAMQNANQRSSMPAEKMNKIFEHSHILEKKTAPLMLPAPPQPNRQAPMPRKEPNARHQPSGKYSRGSDSEADCCTSCKCSDGSSSGSSSVECRPGNRYRDIRYISRIPKPIINDIGQGQRNSTSSAMMFSEANENLQRRIKQMFEYPERGNDGRDDTHCHYAELRFPNKNSPTSPPQQSRKSFDLPPRSEEASPLNDLLRQSRQSASSSSAGKYQKMKMERIHIRKKRQPLLIINQLKDEDEPLKSPKGKAEGEKLFTYDFDEKRQSERLTCGYKNCNFTNCPMSMKHKEEGELEEKKESQNKLECLGKREKDLDRVKRLSLESSSDSGVSTSHDCKEQMQENNRKNLKKCEDCVKIMQNNGMKSFDKDFNYQKGKTSSKSSPSHEGDEFKKLEASEANGQIKIHIVKGQTFTADPNDVQNFAKKNLTKTTTDEMLTAALNNCSTNKSTIKSKECNIENERKNNLRQRTTIKIDDDWVQETPFEATNVLNGAGAANDDDEFIESDSLMPTPTLSSRKPINANDNCVKIFVRSSTSNSNSGGNNNGGGGPRASSVSANSYTSRTSGCSSMSSNSTVSTNDESLHHEECCKHIDLNPPIKSGGVYFNSHNACMHSSASSPSSTSTSSSSSSSCRSVCSESRRACPPSPLSSLDECSSRTLASRFKSNSNSNRLGSTKTDPLNCCTDAVGGVFWNNSYDDDNQCCCSLSSCDEDNCSYYEGSGGRMRLTGGGIGSLVVIESAESPRSVDACERRFNGPMHPQQRRQMQQDLRLSSAEEILIRNKKLLRKTDVLHELRPRSMDGVVDSGVSLSGDTGSSPDSSEHLQNQQQDSESRRLKRGHVLSELLETERIYVSEMSSILKGYCDQMQSEEMMHLVPTSLQGKEDILFGNLHELYTFHNETFLKDLENCISTTELVALCFVQRRDTFYRLYSFYCQNIPRSERLRETLVDTHLFLQECQKRLGHKLPLGAYLLKPVQRITKYQLLLKDLLRFSDSGNCTKELQKALDCMLIVLKCVNDSMHQVAITGFPTDLSQPGELLLQDSFQVWTESKKDIRLRIKPQQRHIFLYQKSMLFCKLTSKPGHNKSTYQFKHHLKMSQIGLTESVRGDTKRFEVWLQGRQEVHTLQAPTIEIKTKWVSEIKRVLLNQLEELKGEKIKQYGLNHRGLKQTTSWDTPNIILGSTQQRTISCDASSESSNRNSNCSGSSGDDNCSGSGISVIQNTIIPPTSASAATTSGGIVHQTTGIDKDQHEACGWSSDYSNSEDEMSIIEDNSTPKFMNFLAQWSYSHDGPSYPPRNGKSNSKFYVSVEQ